MTDAALCATLGELLRLGLIEEECDEERTYRYRPTERRVEYELLTRNSALGTDS
jgi:hypothetical protein